MNFFQKSSKLTKLNWNPHLCTQDEKSAYVSSETETRKKYIVSTSKVLLGYLTRTFLADILLT